jgi:hypothetical protein
MGQRGGADTLLFRLSSVILLPLFVENRQHYRVTYHTMLTDPVPAPEHWLRSIMEPLLTHRTVRIAHGFLARTFSRKNQVDDDDE